MKERGDVLVRIRYGVTERYHSNSKCNASWVCVGGGGGGQKKSHTTNHDKHTTSPNILFPHLITALCGVIVEVRTVR